MQKTKKRVLKLLKCWCDNLLEYQISQFDTAFLNGGIICPTCALIHGRCADLTFPLMTLYFETGEEKYKNAAEQLIDWSENNIKCEDGSYRNDLSNTWKGITIFSATALGEALLHFGNRLDKQLRSKWYGIFIRLTNSMVNLLEQDIIKPNINYYCGFAALMALAGRLTGDIEYTRLADKWERLCSTKFDEQGLLYGEGHPIDKVTAKGCHAIDMGYNLEESLPLLILYSVWRGSEQKRRFYAEKMLNHLEFVLPDGAIDNSFGTRHNKWTYWGSRTSDGMQEGLVHITDINPVFAKAALKNFELLESCTHDGMLYQGPMSFDAEEPACIHHAFTHAKAMAEMYLCMNEADFEECDNALLPREKEYGIKSFQSGNLYTVAVGGWRSTISAVDIINYTGAENFGGSLNLLWHRGYGPICAATMHHYMQSEPTNMQYLRNSFEIFNLTPRIESGEYSSVCEKNVQLSSLKKTDEIIVTAESKEESEFWFQLKYRFSKSRVEISILSNIDGRYMLPVAAYKNDNVEISDHTITIRDSLKLSVFSAEFCRNDTKKRYFNQVGGLSCYPAEIKLKADKTAVVHIEVL